MLTLPEDKLKNSIVQEGLLTPEQYDRIVAEAARLDQPVQNILISKNVITQEYYDNLISSFFGIPFAKLDTRNIDENVMKLIPETVARQKRVIVFGREAEGTYSVALEDPTDLANIAYLEKFLKEKIKPYFASEADFNKGFAMYSKAVAEDYKKIIRDSINLSLQKKITGEKGKSKAVQIALEEFVRQDQIRRLLEAPGNITLDDKVMEWRHSERGKLREFNIDESDSI